MEVRRDDYCFVCSQKNPRGLKIKFKRIPQENPEHVEAEFQIDKFYQGYKDVVHGGIIMTILDEAMAYLQPEDKAFLTGSFKAKFHSPLKVGEKAVVRAKFLKKRSKVCIAYAKIESLKDERVIAEAEAVMFLKPL